MSPQSPPQGYAFRRAETADAPPITELVDVAYGHYVPRLGMRPGPMTLDYRDVIGRRQVTVVETEAGGADRRIVGVVVLGVDDEGFVVENVAVDPSHRGVGLGRALLDYAETQAREAGFDAIHLYTHEKMNENLALYARLGYAEYDRRSQGDFSLVYLRKPLRPQP